MAGMRCARLKAMNRTRLLILLALPMATLAQAKVYRWVDVQGQVHYSQTPPPEIGAEPQAIRAIPATPAPPAATPKPTTAVPAAAPKLDEKAERDAKAKRCSEAKERIAYLEEKTARRLGVEQPDGSLSRMTEEEFQERLGKARDEAGKNCGA